MARRGEGVAGRLLRFLGRQFGPGFRSHLPPGSKEGGQAHSLNLFLKKRKEKENESPGYTPPPKAWGRPLLRFPGTCVPEQWRPGQDSRTRQKSQQALPGGCLCTEDSVPQPRFRTSGVFSESAAWFTFPGSLGWKRPDPLCNPLQKQGVGVGARPGGVCSELQRERLWHTASELAGPEIRTCVLLSCNLAWVTASASRSGVGKGSNRGLKYQPQGPGRRLWFQLRRSAGVAPMAGRCGGPAGEERALWVVCAPHPLAGPNPDHPRLEGIQSPKGPLLGSETISVFFSV